MEEIAADQVKIKDSFWSPKLAINTRTSIFHQWQMLETSGCIDNFRIAAGEKEGFRRGWFFADSDATKWLDAAARIVRSDPDLDLTALIDDFIALLGRAQEKDGYLFTYNQIHFPGQRWINLQIEHELYCFGHLIEAGVSHYQSTGRTELLQISRKAADLLIKIFLHSGPEFTPGHEEIEIALLRLWQVTGHESYRDLAIHFLEERGKTPFFGINLFKQFISNGMREKFILKKRQEYLRTHEESSPLLLPHANEAKRPPFSVIRFLLSGLSGKYFQQHRPIRQQNIPVGHSVRFGYLETAQAMMLRDKPEEALLLTMQQAWEHMVSRRMDVTGALGALPDLEGFGRDFEFNPETAYNETCAGIASLYWNWQMALLSSEAKYCDLFEWQLYNSVSAGVDLTGKNYFYNNPTLCKGGIVRQPWYSIPCCPSNISRTFADLGKYIFSYDPKNLWIHQFIGCKAQVGVESSVEIEVSSGFPWHGESVVNVISPSPQEFTLWLRKPSWAAEFTIFVNGEPWAGEFKVPVDHEPTAMGFDPRNAAFIPIRRQWHGLNEVKYSCELGIKLLRAHPKVKGLHDKVALTRGPIVFCLVNVDNSEVDIFNSIVDIRSLEYEFRPGFLGGTGIIKGCTTENQDLIFIPYFLWGNRGESKMTVWVKGI